MEKEKINQTVHNMDDTTFEIFCMMLELKTQTEIAKELNMDIKKVKYHVGKIYKSFEIQTCKAETQSKRLLFTRTLVDVKPKYGLESVLHPTDSVL